MSSATVEAPPAGRRGGARIGAGAKPRPRPRACHATYAALADRINAGSLAALDRLIALAEGVKVERPDGPPIYQVPPDREACVFLVELAIGKRFDRAMDPSIVPAR